jgi:hypothetical protein
VPVPGNKVREQEEGAPWTLCPMGKVWLAQVHGTGSRSYSGGTRHPSHGRSLLPRKGLTFVSVHDCFWTHAADVPVMNQVRPCSSTEKMESYSVIPQAWCPDLV